MTTTTEQCKCTLYMDIRGRCEPTDSSWAKCPVKVDTTFFILNHSDDYKKFCLEKVGTRTLRNKKARKIASVKYGLTEDELDGLDECFTKDDADDECFQCRCCCKPISLENENDDGKYDNCEDEWICWECYDEHYCCSCKEFYEELEIKGDEEGTFICKKCVKYIEYSKKSPEQKKKEWEDRNGKGSWDLCDFL